MKPWPHDDEAEEAVLGGILYDPEVIPRVVEILEPEDFYAERNRLVYMTMLDLDDHGQTPDVLAVARALRGKVDPVKIRDLAAEVGTPSATPGHAAHVASLARSRRLASRLNQALNDSFDADP